MNQQTSNHMELLTQKQIEALTAKYPLYSQDGRGLDAVVSYKFFYPAGGATWYLTEASQEGEGVTCFGICIVGDPRGEWGYFSLNELQALNINGVEIERDLHFKPAKVRDLATSEPYLRDFIEYWTE